MLCDTHIHSLFSPDSDAAMEDMVSKAAELGIPVVCFTDHVDWDFPYDDVVYDIDAAEYFKSLRAIRKKFEGRIRVLTGVELGLQPQLADRYQAFVRENDFDFIIGSQHLVFGKDPYYPEVFVEHAEEEVIRRYFEETCDNLKRFHDFDTMGHLDYIVRNAKERERTYSYRVYADIIDEILKQLVKYNIAVEINTAGLRKRQGFPNPHPEILKRYRELGGTLVTVGSDAHRPAHIGYAFDYAAEVLRYCGFTHYVCYEKRTPRFIKL